MGVPFLRGLDLLTVSMERRTLKCTYVLLKYLIDLAETVKRDEEWPTFKCINTDIPALLGCGSTPPFLQSFPSSSLPLLCPLSSSKADYC